VVAVMRPMTGPARVHGALFVERRLVGLRDGDGRGCELRKGRALVLRGGGGGAAVLVGRGAGGYGVLLLAGGGGVDGLVEGGGWGG
jgi:hypothetical protein